METKDLNEYLFTDLVVQYSLAHRNRRLKAEGMTGDMAGVPFTSEDLRAGLQQLQRCHDGVRALLREAPPEAPAL